MKIYYLTRSLYPFQKTGGGQIRKAQVDFFRRQNNAVTVVMPNYHSNETIINQDIIQIPYTQNIRMAFLLQRLGVYEDYLDSWVKKAFDYLQNKITKEDIIFATSGSELASIKLGSLLKTCSNCKFIINFHDPLGYTSEFKLDNKIHISRDKFEKQYLQNADFIVTSSLSHKHLLMEKYPEYSLKILNSYFGYVAKKSNTESHKKDTLKIAYVGAMTNSQAPENLLYAYRKLNRLHQDKVHVYFIGDYSNYSPLQNIKDKNIFFIHYMPHNKFLKFMDKSIDVGYIGLSSDSLKYCVPSKLYEYINLEKPILANIPKGDAYSIIEQNTYGVCCYNDIQCLVRSIEYLRHKEQYDKCKNSIIRDKHHWSFEYQIEKMYSRVFK